MARRLRLTHNDAGEALYSMQTEEEARRLTEHPLLGRTPEELVREGDRHIEELLHLLEDADGRAVARAGERVLAYGEPGVMALLGLISRRTADIPEVATVHAMATLSRVRGQPLPAGYRAMVERAEDPRARRDLLRVVGVVVDESALDLLIDGLEDEHEDVRAEAIDSLWLVTGETLDFDAEAGRAERAESVERWRAWLQSRGSTA
jgi:HEAT repeat protein